MKTRLAMLFGWAVAALVPTTGAAQVLAPIVDVMVVYEGNAFAASPNINVESDEIINSANNALQQSGLAERYSKVYVHPQPLPVSIGPNTTDSQVEDAMTENAQVASLLASLRNTHGADLVVLVTENLHDDTTGESHCGVAWANLTVMPHESYRDTAFRMAVYRPCILAEDNSAHTAAAHELGHLLYLDHQLDVAPTPDTNPANPVRYNHPHFSGNISTLMVGGPTACPAGCAIANLHSDPQATYPGTTIVRGHSFDRDDKRMIFETFQVVSRYKNPNPGCSGNPNVHKGVHRMRW